ncbi:MAG: type II toxin-antitoxin system RelE/ParE family toxin [Actinomycetota bacterium]
MYRLIILPRAANYLKKIKEKPLKLEFQKIIDNIIQNPYIGTPKIGDQAGVYCCDFFYNKVNYELAYTIIKKNENTIVVILAGTRENFYYELKRYMKNTKFEK